MASAATPLPIYYNYDVHHFYIKQKHEFHFNQKSDNEFLMFLLDTAVRVISIVQHLAPVIEAVSDAGADADDIDDDISPIHTPIHTPNVNVSSGAMDVDDVEEVQQPPPLSAELEQINQEITNAQISSHLLPRLPKLSIRRPPAKPASVIPILSLVSAPISDHEVMQTVAQPTAPVPSTIHIPTSHIPTSHIDNSHIDNSHTSTPLAPNVPAIQLPSSAQSSENISTSLPSATQPIAEPPVPDDSQVKTELPIPEVIEIKEELSEPAISASSSSELLSQDTLQQLMSSISGTEDNVGIQNFVPTATPSSLPPCFLDRGGNNPLSMLGSLNAGDGPGPSGIQVPNISESMMKNINDAGLNVSSIKGQANPNSGLSDGYNLAWENDTTFIDADGSGQAVTELGVNQHGISLSDRSCQLCGRIFTKKCDLKRHINQVHLKLRPYRCEMCYSSFPRRTQLRAHVVKFHNASDLTMVHNITGDQIPFKISDIKRD